MDKGCRKEGAILIVLDPQKNNIDKEKTRLVLRHPSWKVSRQPVYRASFLDESALGQSPVLADRKLRLTEDALTFANYSVFIYGGATYFDLWWSAHWDYEGRPDYERGRLRVFLAKAKDVREICKYRFKIEQ